MKVLDILLESLDPKPVPSASRTRENDSFKCESYKEFKKIIVKLSDGKERLDIAVILDIKSSVAYITNRTTFHKDMALVWGIPYSFTNKNFPILTATYIEGKGLLVDKSKMFESHKRELESTTSWLKKVFS